MSSRQLVRRDRPDRRGTLARVAGQVAGLVALTAGGVVAGFELEKRIVGSRFRRPGESGLGTLHGAARDVVTSDGVRLHVEVDEPQDHPGAASGWEGLTVVLVHGYCLDMDCWHFQRQHLRGRARIVAYDQRSHGRSGRSESDQCRIPRLADDLAQILDEVIGDGPVVLLGHSMGGMTIMNLARRRPDLLAERVAGVGLLCTASGNMADFSPVPGIDGRFLSRIAAPLLTTLNRIPVVVSRAREAGSDIGYVATKKFAFGSSAPVDLVEYVATMLGRVPLDVVADFYPAAFAELDEEAAMAELARVETLVIGAEQDSITPVEHTRRIIELLPGADAVVLERAGHLAMMEHAEEVNRHIDDLIDRAMRHGA